MKRIITVVVQNRSGVLNRVTGLFSKRQWNIESLSVGPAEKPGCSKMTIVVEIDDDIHLDPFIKQLNKQIDCLSVSDLTDQAIVARELVLIKVLCHPQILGEIRAIVEPFRASIIDVSATSVTIEVTGDADKNDAIIEMLKPYGIKELARTGITALPRGRQRSVTEIKPRSVI
ncbi:acetolactate synthase small subunit [Tuberibacillus calidus]|jgi:acetolactate synthase-1/3 small subunit|uniref:acetolactate synthase small subunit n=1 Tax=Tuberibacillus calidus TaxID=340097 RepID=UPI000403E9CA|nr:acetolactate synthase small subunit [Tuberibacillus calidus]